jgi:hypothetical protein
VAGIVRDSATSVALEGVTVVVGDREVVTTAEGTFEVDSVPVGDRQVAASKSGYRPQTTEVEVEGGATVTLALKLAPLLGPANVAAITSGEAPGTIRVTWEPIGEATGYTVFWASQIPVDTVKGVPVPGASSPFIHTELSGGTTFCYIVVAHTPDGDTRPSDRACATPESPISITFVVPTPGQVVDERFGISVEIGSVFQLSAVTARIGDVTRALAPATVPGWETDFDLSDLAPSGPQILHYTATDVMGNVGRTALLLRLDRRPVVTLSAPVAGAFAGPSIRVVAACADEDLGGGCEGLFIQANGLTLVRATSTVDQLVSLADFDGEMVTLTAVGRDGAHVVRVSTSVYVDASPHLTPVASVGSGTLIDASADRLLAVDPELFQLGSTLRAVTRSTGESTMLHHAPQGRVDQGALFPDGAIFLVRDELSRTILKEWRNGAFSDLALSVDPFKIEGTYALWRSGTVLTRRDLSSGTDSAIVGPANPDYDVAVDGELAYSFGGEIFLHDGSDAEQLTNDGGGDFRNLSPVTDGIHVVYTRQPVMAPMASIRLSDPTGEITLASNINRELRPGADYAVNNGWVAFVRPDATNVLQIWRRSPEGEETQVTAFGTSSTIESMGDEGEIVFTSSATGVKRRYRARVGSDLEDISSGLGRAIYIEGQLHLLVGPTLLRVN